jgi:hypothetical protein
MKLNVITRAKSILSEIMEKFSDTREMGCVDGRMMMFGCGGKKTQE